MMLSIVLVVLNTLQSLLTCAVNDAAEEEGNWHRFGGFPTGNHNSHFSQGGG
jgi:hypothetical protein